MGFGGGSADFILMGARIFLNQTKHEKFPSKIGELSGTGDSQRDSRESFAIDPEDVFRAN